MEQTEKETVDETLQISRRFNGLEKRIQEQVTHAIRIEETYQRTMVPLNHVFMQINGATTEQMGVIYEMSDDSDIARLREACWKPTNEITKLLTQFRSMSHMGMSAHMRMSDAYNQLRLARRLVESGNMSASGFDAVADLVGLTVQQVAAHLPNEVENVDALAKQIHGYFGQLATTYEAFVTQATFH